MSGVLILVQAGEQTSLQMPRDHLVANLSVIWDQPMRVRTGQARSAASVRRRSKPEVSLRKAEAIRDGLSEIFTPKDYILSRRAARSSSEPTLL